MAVENFRLISEFLSLQTRDFTPAVASLMDPTGLRPLIDGEFLIINGAGQAAREGDNNAGTADESLIKAWPTFFYKGSYDVQMLNKVPLLWIGNFEAETLIMLATGILQGSALSVRDVAVGGIVYRGLGLATVAGWTMGYAHKLPAVNNGWLRFTTCDY